MPRRDALLHTIVKVSTPDPNRDQLISKPKEVYTVLYHPSQTHPGPPSVRNKGAGGPSRLKSYMKGFSIPNRKGLWGSRKGSLEASSVAALAGALPAV